MRAKRLVLTALTVMLFTASLACYTAIPAAAESVNWIAVNHRTDSEAGVWFVLSEFIQHVDNHDQGYYEFAFTAHDNFPALGGCAYKIVTARGSNTRQRWLTFTPRDPRTGTVTLVTRMPNDGGLIPASFIASAAAANQNMLFCTQDDQNPFVIREVIVTHILNDGSEVEVYRMTEDPLVRSLNSGDVFTGGSMGFAPSAIGGEGSSPIAELSIVSGEAEEIERPERPLNGITNNKDTEKITTEETVASSGVEFPAPVTNEGENSLIMILLAAVGASVAGSIAGALILKRG